MRTMKSWTGVLLLSFLVFTFFASCDNEDDPRAEKEKIVGEWNIKEFSTDNAALDLALSMLMSTEGIQLTSGTFTFEENSVARINVPQSGKLPVKFSATYEITDSQLAFRFDELIPLPFNTDLKRLTGSELTMQIVIPPVAINALVTLAEMEKPELAATLKALLGESLHKELTATIHLER